MLRAVVYEPVGETADSPGAGASSSETTPEWEDRRPEAVEVEQLDELLDDNLPRDWEITDLTM